MHASLLRVGFLKNLSHHAIILIMTDTLLVGCPLDVDLGFLMGK